MDISSIITKILLKEEETYNIAKLDFNNQDRVLEMGLKSCAAVQNIIPEKYRSLKNLDPANYQYFPKLNAPTGPTPYLAAPYEKGEVRGKIVLFGLPYGEPKGTEGRTFKAYVIGTDGTTKIVERGWGSSCEFTKELSQIGQEPLTALQSAQLESWLKRNGYAYSLLDPKTNNVANSEEYGPPTLVRDLKNASNNEPALPGYTGDYKIWIHQGLSNIGADQAKNLETMLAKQMFTQDLSNIPTDSDAHDFAFYLSDIIKDLPQLDQVRSLVKNDILIYPKNEILVEPERGICRTVINKLYDCGTKSSTPGCREDLFKNKLTAIRCSDKNFIGRTDDKFQKIASDSGTYGILNLINAKRRGLNKEANKTVRESIKNTVLSVLTEEIRKKNR
jgi:hypothetical protein